MTECLLDFAGTYAEVVLGNQEVETADTFEVDFCVGIQDRLSVVVSVLFDQGVVQSCIRSGNIASELHQSLFVAELGSRLGPKAANSDHCVPPSFIGYVELTHS